MDDQKELDKLVGEETTTPKDAQIPKSETDKSEEDLKKEQHKNNLDVAIKEANELLRAIRKEKKELSKPVEEKIPQIDFNDPGSKAWDSHITDKVAPVREALDKEAEEVFEFTFKEFIKDKPLLQNNADRRKSFIETYERLKKSSGRTREGVQMDLEKAFGAEFHKELVDRATDVRIERTKVDELFSSPAVTRNGSASIRNEEGTKITLSEDDKSQLQKWGMTPEEYIELKKKYK